jgi:predicted Zn-dependent protease
MREIRFGLCLLAGGIIAVMMTGCATAPMTDAAIEEEAAEQFRMLKGALPLSNDYRKNAQVKRVGDRIAQIADLPGARWEFVVFEDPALNAFAMPGGKVGVFTGLLDIVASDDELAVVMGHEIAHVTLKHAKSQAIGTNVNEAFGTILSIGTAATTGISPYYTKGIYDMASDVAFMLPHSRAHELEADRAGLQIMMAAGYNAKAAISFWEKMAGQDGGAKPPPWLSTHPSHGNRISRVRELVANATGDSSLLASVPDGAEGEEGTSSFHQASAGGGNSDRSSEYIIRR